jgi:hypothetical protein
VGRRQRLRTNAQRRQLCRASGKDIFSTEQEAAARLREILGKPGALDNPYRPADTIDCAACGGFHLTSSVRKPGVTARRRQPKRLPLARRVTRARRTPHAGDDVGTPAHQPGASWTSGFAATPGQPGLTHRITIDTLPRSRGTSALASDQVRAARKH